MGNKGSKLKKKDVKELEAATHCEWSEEHERSANNNEVGDVYEGTGCSAANESVSDTAPAGVAWAALRAEGVATGNDRSSICGRPLESLAARGQRALQRWAVCEGALVCTL
jgi:hypothetical protein